jgi:hypothetical protein
MSNVLVEWMQLLTCFPLFSSVPTGKFLDSTLKYATITSFHIHNSYLTIRRHKPMQLKKFHKITQEQINIKLHLLRSASTEHIHKIIASYYLVDSWPVPAQMPCICTTKGLIFFDISYLGPFADDTCVIYPFLVGFILPG